ncbi:ATP-dependent helicase, partial [Candidatus Peregrinibacteria bacterium]|nr:ATP-dependent helicase [Candidatus Peregrinibacteria bacterium]
MNKVKVPQSAQSKPPKPIASSSKFAEEYTKLNPDQRKAVETIEGPVMVVAGPGTGKTQVLAMRVANILKRTQMRPSNVLCLTFSVSGATAMRERLRRLIGADAYAVTVSTIHAFAQSIIEQQPQLFDRWSARKQLSDIEKIRQMNTIIDQISAHSELINPKDPYGKVPELLSRISQVKREGKSHRELLKCADEYDAAMQNKSKAGTKAQEKNLRAARMFRDFTDIFRRYQEMLGATGHFDYDDSILYVIRALEEDDDLLASLQERYQYVLVDEFQDTNGAQYRLIELLTAYRTLPHEPNLFIVGDDDQAIYRFQGANLRNMLAFHERFPEAPVIALTVSYRSTQAILSTAQQLIERNDERLVGRIPGLQKILTAASGEKGTAPMLLRPASDTAEAWLIADLIVDRIKRGILPQEIAILTQTNQELFPIYDVLRARKIPVILRGKDDLLSHPLVLQALTILHAVEQSTHDSRLSAALGCPCFDISPVDLARLHGVCRERKVHMTDLLLSLPQEEESPLMKAEALLSARTLILDLQAKLHSRTALETVEHVLRDCHLVPEVSNPADSKLDPRDCAVIEAFFSYVKKQCLERPHCTLTDLLSELRLYGDPTYGQVRLTYELPHLTTEGVQLMTAHQSKGLEFDVVILTNFRDGHWDRRTRRSMISIPEDIVFGWEKEQKNFEQHQDERRVCFVAMTRARRELVFTCPKEMTVGEKARTVSPSGFFAEMGDLPEQDGS